MGFWFIVEPLYVSKINFVSFTFLAKGPGVSKVGDKGKTSSALRPYGKAVFSDKFYEVKSSENFIDENKKIKIINILQDKIIVKKI